MREERGKGPRCLCGWRKGRRKLETDRVNKVKKVVALFDFVKKAILVVIAVPKSKTPSSILSNDWSSLLKHR